MDYNEDITFTKSTCEKYTLKFNNGWDFAVFTIDNMGLLQCCSSYGDYSYKWSAFGNDFKRFLCQIDLLYLLCKIADKTYFDFESYEKKTRKAIIKERRNGELTKEEARDLWSFMEELNDCSYDLICDKVYNNEILYNLYGEVFYSDFYPKQDYTPDARKFAYRVFPIFTDILKQELEQSNS